MATNSNNKENVSLGKPKASGFIYRAPAGTDIPKDATTDLPQTFKCVGYVGEDGVTQSADVDKTEVKDAGGVTVLSVITSYAETYQFVMLELNETSATIRYGSDAVKATDNTMTITHKMPSGESAVFVFELLCTGNKARRIVVPDATPNDFGDTQYHIGDAVAYDVTLAANPSDKIDGGTSVEYIAPITSPQKSD
ncbi:phage major tail protein [Bifidobacterium sp. DSM 109960]|uniref:Phage major tail protein n=1 Tax=Bifidobacterium erythrocebi TaxID=2675325 RepID=A0A7Y0HVJ4_9BIFI|nr:hypothetical protein [Bifidobacterium sp. DSM 109960]NMM96287.1 phage major tail protein [Bifidobacterium sp. DSM 109960]